MFKHHKIESEEFEENLLFFCSTDQEVQKAMT